MIVSASPSLQPSNRRPHRLRVTACVLAGLLTATGNGVAAHSDYLRAFREANCPVPMLKQVTRIKEDAGHVGHADAFVYEATCPRGRVVTVTCLESGCRVDRPLQDDTDR